MFNTALLYEIVAKQTPYDVIIGGSDLPANFDKGCVIITLINSQVLTQSYKDNSKITTQDDTHTIQSTTRVQNNYQFDFLLVQNLLHTLSLTLLPYPYKVHLNML